LNLIQFLINSFIILVGSLIQACIGFGFSLVAAPLLTLVISPTKVVVIMTLLSFVSNLFMITDTRKSLRLKLILPLVAGAMIGLPIGVYILGHLEPRLIKALVGVIVIIFAVILTPGIQLPLSWSQYVLFPAGFISGIIHASTSLGGPPVVVALASQQVEKNIFRATTTSLFLLMNIGILPVMAWQGLLEWSTVKLALINLPALCIGTWIGTVISRHVPEILFRKLVLVAVFWMGLIIIIVNLFWL
jgi:uncharacterized protein